VGEDQETPLADVLVDTQCSSPEDKYLEREMNDGVGEVYCQLNGQQQTVIAHRYGLLGERPLTLQETGERMGVSRERVRQIENQAKERMRKLFEKKRRVNSPPRSAARARGAAPVPQLTH
jgi:RNA polymerase sigma factor (sigma-70 family)